MFRGTRYLIDNYTSDSTSITDFLTGGLAFMPSPWNCVCLVHDGSLFESESWGFPRNAALPIGQLL